MAGHETTVTWGREKGAPWLCKDGQLLADAKPQILIVEDSDAIRTLVRHILEEEGYPVLEASEGEEAVSVAYAADNIGLILLDIVLPGEDGYYVLKSLRQLKEERGIKICMISGTDVDTNVEKSLAMGADDYVVKALSPEVLLHKVNTLLGLDHDIRSFSSTTIQMAGICHHSEGSDPITVVRVSEVELEIISPRALEPHTHLRLECPFLLCKSETNDTISARVVDCARAAGGYRVKTELIGIPNETMALLRRLTILGH